MGFRPVLRQIIAADGPRPPPRGRTPDPDRMENVTPEQLEKEREAFMERRRKQMESARAAMQESQERETRVLSRAERKKLREDDYIPPEE